MNSKPASKELISMISNFGKQAGSIKTISERIKEKASAEGFDEFEIGLLAREILKERWTKDQLYRWFPTKPKVKLEESTSGNSTESEIVGKKDTEETYPDKGFISDKEKIPEDKVFKPDNEEHEQTKQKLTQVTEDSRAKDERINDLLRKNEQLESVVKKESFKLATNAEDETFHLTLGVDVRYFKPMKLEQILSKVVSPLRNSSWKSVEIWARNVKE